MASDIKNTGEDVDMAECDDEKVVTMMDVLREQEDFEEDANAVLGASDEKECTYSKGYIKRQAIYACLTCCSEAKSDPTKRAGVCLACSLMCHENHELIELYTKRNFRCDCGNPKFNSHPCTFISNKTDCNEDNSYNQNFSGLYCTCQRPYPDPESTVEDEMIQCIICEDWLHASHLGSPLPTNNQYSEMICKTCMARNEFLHDYGSLAVNTESADVDVVNVKGVEENLSSISKSDAKAEENTDSTSITNGNKSDVEMTVEKLETSTTSETKTQIKEPKDSEVDLKDTANENDVTIDKTVIENEDKKETVIEKAKNDDTVIVNQNKQETVFEKDKNNETVMENEKQGVTLSANETNTNDSVSEQAVSGITQEKSINMSENANTDQEKASENIEGNSNSAENSNSDEKNNESKKIDEQINENTEPNSDIKVSDETKTLSESKDKNKQIIDEEKMEEDRLLAEPEDENVSINKDPTPIETNLENNPTDTEKGHKDLEEEGTKSKANESAPTDKTENNISIDGNKKENDPNLDINSTTTETTDVAINDSVSTANAEIQSEKESDNSADPNNAIDNNKEPSSSERISEKRKLEDEIADTLEVKKPKIDACVRPKGVKKIYNGATFWPSNFRQKLCLCQECISMYKDLSVLFLTDPEDTVSAYESLGKERLNGQPATQYEKGMQALSSLDRIQQINALTEYNRMRDKLLDFLKSFKDKKEIVTEEDIKAFFVGMKPKREPDGVYFCR